MTYKALLHHTYTKKDIYGNVYHTVRITNPKTGKSVTTSTPSLGNVEHILNSIFPYTSFHYPYYTTECCTDSARLSSLPDHVYLNDCHPKDDWKKALRSIGYRLPKKDTE
jgi:hypothetical protein